MSKIAVIKTGGKQYKVKEGDIIEIEKLPGKAGETITFNDVLLITDGKETEIGMPTLDKKAVTAVVLEQYQTKKVTAYKYKAKTRYRRKLGHRQEMVKVKIGKIS